MPTFDDHVCKVLMYVSGLEATRQIMAIEDVARSHPAQSLPNLSHLLSVSKHQLQNYVDRPGHRCIQSGSLLRFSVRCTLLRSTNHVTGQEMLSGRSRGV